MQLASRLNRIAESQTIRMAKLGRELKAQGIDVIDLSIGEPDFDTPAHIKEAAKRALDEGYTHYPPVAGYPELRRAIAEKLKTENNWEVLPEQIVVSNGAKQAIANVMLSLLNPGDEVIIPTPYWVSYADITKLAEGTPVFVHCGFEQQYKLKPEQLEQAITPRTRAIIYSSPSNPTGALYSKEELAALAEVLRRHPHVFIISDEIYEYINYVGKHQSITQFQDLIPRTIVINGFSKGFAMTGWRLGYSVSPLPIAKACDTIQGQFTSGANAFAQRGALYALQSSRDACQQMVCAFRERRDFIVKALQQIPGLRFHVPEGAFYLFPEVKAYFGKTDGKQQIQNADDLAMYLLHQAHVSTVTGTAFGEPDCIRLSYANSLEKLSIAMQRIREALQQLH
ncbi:MAG: pyridoxal phosphate-dependent aminotransferase [Thermoflavifilum sp.]|uniref:pyridoxal phosphate-dependent aminotransferase n=1 Tax=Thermoflavifilum sp. TaxID=1968839 RepID=UPI0018A5E5AF|nr:pyridoxal phosphate-dependent aminotransferase [Thermoflavifilum sp.]QOR75579.1 MAG: pyridoxal phosphate-dependent aminotransferase [Thermoflavifilum sp.]